MKTKLKSMFTAAMAVFAGAFGAAAGDGVDYLSFTARDAAVSVSLKRVGAPEDFELEYALTPTSAVWTAYTPGSADAIAIAEDTTVYLRRKDSAVSDGLSLSTKNYWQFEMTGAGKVWANGRLASLLDKSGSNETVGDYGFFRLFAGCTNLVSSPIIPSNISGKQCCQSLFDGCSNLKRVEVKFTKFGDTTINWLKGVAAKGLFIRPSALKVTSKTVNTVPYGWTDAISVLATIPNEIENATYVVKNGNGDELVPTHTGYNGTNSTYVLGRTAEDLVVELTPAEGYTFDAVVPFRINATDLTAASYDLGSLIPQAKQLLWRVTKDSTDNVFGSLSLALSSMKDGSTMTAIDTAPNPIPCDCEFVIDQNNVTLDFNGHDIATNRIFMQGTGATAIVLKNASYNGSIYLDSVKLSIAGDTQVTNDTCAIVCTNNCVLALGDGKLYVDEGEPKVMLRGITATLSTSTDFAANAEITLNEEDYENYESYEVVKTYDGAAEYKYVYTISTKKVTVVTNGLEIANVSYSLFTNDIKLVANETGEFVVLSNAQVTVKYDVQAEGIYFLDGTTNFVATFTADKPVNVVSESGVVPEAPESPNVKLGVVAQRYPWNGKIDVHYWAKNTPPNEAYQIVITITLPDGTKASETHDCKSGKNITEFDARAAFGEVNVQKNAKIRATLKAK